MDKRRYQNMAYSTYKIVNNCVCSNNNRSEFNPDPVGGASNVGIN